MTHADVRELIPTYALGALEPDEAGIVQEHLEDCAFCSNLAREAGEIAHCLPFAAAFRVAPEGSLERLLASVRPRAAAPEPARAEPVRGPSAGERLQGWLARFLRGPVLAPLAVLIVIIAGISSWNMVLMGELKEERRQVEALQNRLGQQTHLLVMVTSNSAVTRPLQGTALAPSAEVRLIMDAETNTAMLMASRLPPLAAGQIYQVWLGRQGARMPAAKLQVDQQGDGECALQLDASVHSYDSAWITLEPAQGGPMPNSPGVAKGSLI